MACGLQNRAWPYSWKCHPARFYKTAHNLEFRILDFVLHASLPWAAAVSRYYDSRTSAVGFLEALVVRHKRGKKATINLAFWDCANRRTSMQIRCGRDGSPTRLLRRKIAPYLDCGFEHSQVAWLEPARQSLPWVRLIARLQWLAPQDWSQVGQRY